MQSFLNVITLQTHTFFTTLTPRLHGCSKRFFRRPQDLNAPRIRVFVCVYIYVSVQEGKLFYAWCRGKNWDKGQCNDLFSLSPSSLPSTPFPRPRYFTGAVAYSYTVARMRVKRLEVSSKWTAFTDGRRQKDTWLVLVYVRPSNVVVCEIFSLQRF